MLASAERNSHRKYFSDTYHGLSRLEQLFTASLEYLCTEFYALREAAFLIPTHYCRSAGVQWKLIIHQRMAANTKQQRTNIYNTINLIKSFRM